MYLQIHIYTMQVCCIGRDDEIIGRNELLAWVRRYALYPYFYCFLRQDTHIHIRSGGGCIGREMATATPHIDDVRLEVERVKASPLISNINVCVEEVTNLIDKSSSISSSGASGSGSCINRRNSDSARQKQQHYKYNVNTCIPVRTEFVYADGGKEAVQLCGDWNRWAPISMELESGKISIAYVYLYFASIYILTFYFYICRGNMVRYNGGAERLPRILLRRRRHLPRE